MIATIFDSVLTHLQDSLTGWRVVDMATLDERPVQPIPHTPLLMLAFGGITPHEDVGLGSAQRVSVSIVAVIVGRDARSPREGAKARQSCAGLFDELFAALSGFTPNGASSVLRLKSVDAAEYSPPVFYLPVEFQCSVILKS